MNRGGNVTELLLAFRDGDRAAFDQLVPMLYDDLRKVARAQLRRGRPGATLDTTVLVHELYLKMADQQRLDARDRGHFLAISAHAMRQVIADYARRRTAAKRGGDSDPVPLDEAPEIADREARWLLDVDQALERLAGRDERTGRTPAPCELPESVGEVLDRSRIAAHTMRGGRAWAMIVLARARRGGALAPRRARWREQRWVHRDTVSMETASSSISRTGMRALPSRWLRASVLPAA